MLVAVSEISHLAATNSGWSNDRVRIVVPAELHGGNRRDAASGSGWSETAVCVMDSEKALKTRARIYLGHMFPVLILVLDIIHAVEYLWKSAFAFHELKSEAARLCGSEYVCNAS